MKELDEFYFKLEEPNKSCFLALNDVLCALHPDITPEWKYKLPFFYFRGKMFCFLWIDKKSKLPYIGFMKGPQLHHPALYLGDRKMVKKLFIQPEEDLPLDAIQEIAVQYFELFK